MDFPFNNTKPHKCGQEMVISYSPVLYHFFIMIVPHYWQSIPNDNSQYKIHSLLQMLVVYLTAFWTSVCSTKDNPDKVYASNIR